MHVVSGYGHQYLYHLLININNFGSLNNVAEQTYLYRIQDRRLFTSIAGNGGAGATSAGNFQYNPGSKTSVTVRGQQLNLVAINSSTLFGDKNSLSTTITIQGVESGAKITIPIKIYDDFLWFINQFHFLEPRDSIVKIKNKLIIDKKYMIFLESITPFDIFDK